MKSTVSAALLASLVGCGQGGAAGGPAGPGGDAGASEVRDREVPSLRVPEFGPVPVLPQPPGDPSTADKKELGRLLFFDPRLSGSGHTSCSACHIPNTAFQDSLPLSTPDRSYPSDSPTLSRNTLSFMNLVYAPTFRWDGSSQDLVGVLAFPLAEPNMNIARLPRGETAVVVPPESGNAPDLAPAQDALRARLGSELAGYVPLYDKAFGVDAKSLSGEELWRLTGRALRAFVTVAVSRDAAFDRWNAGDDGAMGASAVRGLSVFRGKGRCFACHSGPLFTDFAFHNLSTSPPGPGGKRADVGRYDVTHDPKDMGAFLTPSLRQAYDTSPYLHDGSAPGIVQVLEHLSSPAVMADPNHDPMFDTPLRLDAGDISDVIAFIEALRGVPIDPPTTPSSFP